MSKPRVNFAINSRLGSEGSRSAVREQMQEKGCKRTPVESAGPFHSGGHLSWATQMYSLPELYCIHASASHWSILLICARPPTCSTLDGLQRCIITVNLPGNAQSDSWPWILLCSSCLGALLLCPCRWYHCPACLAAALGSEFAFLYRSERCQCSLMLPPVLQPNDVKSWTENSHASAFCIHMHSNETLHFFSKEVSLASSQITET